MTYTSKNVQAAVTSVEARSLKNALTTLIVLFKMRIVMLLLFAAWGGAMLGSGGRPSVGAMLLLTVTGILAAGGSGALNQYLERNTDPLMRRTSRRPLATGQIKPLWAVVLGAGSIAASLLLALLAGNPELAFFLGMGAAIYVGVYTVWLKRRTLLNVVIGGAAGSCAVLSGAAAVGNWADPGALLLAALLFTWSPSHFWSLALVYRKDYARARVPMLPVVMPAGRAIAWTLIHMGATGAIALLLAAHPTLGPLYLIPVGLSTLWLVYESVKLVLTPSESSQGQQAMTLFKGSNIYLAVVLLMICVATLL